MTGSVVLICLLLSGCWYWSSALKANEHALKLTKSLCQKNEVQLIDDYVALESLSLKRDASGKFRLSRRFSFEFSATGNERYNGMITLLGDELCSVYMDPYRIESNAVSNPL